MGDNIVLINWDSLIDLCTKIFQKVGLPEREALDASRVLSSADARGIKSHGVARLKMYLKGLEGGVIKTTLNPTILLETPTTLAIDAEGCLGQSISIQMMNSAISKAKNNGIGVAVCRNSNHFGIAGFYSEMAAREGMIGIALTNTAALGVPTFGREAMFGTNPIAFAAPGMDDDIFSLDMATTCVPRGKIEVYKRMGKEIPLGWAVGIDGKGTTDPVSLLNNMVAQKGGGLMPLGGEGELFSGYKGYGLAVLVDILTGVLSGGSFGRDVKDGPVATARVCHFFMALDIGKFRNLNAFKEDISTLLRKLKEMPKAKGQERVYYAGLKEHEREKKSKKEGITLELEVWKTLKQIAQEKNIPIPMVEIK